MGYSRANIARSKKVVKDIPMLEGQLITHPLPSEVDEEGFKRTRVELYTDYYDEDDKEVKRTLLAVSSLTPSAPAVTILDPVEDATREMLIELAAGEPIIFFRSVKWFWSEDPNILQSGRTYTCLYQRPAGQQPTLMATCDGMTYYSGRVSANNWTEWGHPILSIDEKYVCVLQDLADNFCIPDKAKFEINRATFYSADSPDLRGDSVWQLELLKDSSEADNTKDFWITARSDGYEYTNHYHWEDWVETWSGWIRTDGNVKVHTETELQLDATREDLRLKAIDTMAEITGDWRDDFMRVVWSEEDIPDEDYDFEMKCTISKYCGETEDDDIYEANAYYQNLRWVSTYTNETWGNWIPIRSEGILIEVENLEDCSYQPAASTVGYRAYVVKDYEEATITYEKGWWEIVYDEELAAYVWKKVADGIIRLTDYEDPTKEFDIMEWCGDPEPIHDLQTYQLYIAQDVDGDLQWVPMVNDTNVPAGALLAWPDATNAKLPNGFLFCDGSLKSIAAYPELYNIIGRKYCVDTDPASMMRLPSIYGNIICAKGSTPVHEEYINDLTDVNVDAAEDGDSLVYNLATSKWIGGPASRVKAGSSSLTFESKNGVYGYTPYEGSFHPFEAGGWELIMTAQGNYSSWHSIVTAEDYTEVKFIQISRSTGSGGNMLRSYKYPSGEDITFTNVKPYFTEESGWMASLVADAAKADIVLPSNTSSILNGYCSIDTLKNVPKGSNLARKEAYFSTNVWLVLARKGSANDVFTSHFDITNTVEDVTSEIEKLVTTYNLSAILYNGNQLVISTAFTSPLTSTTDVLQLPAKFKSSLTNVYGSDRSGYNEANKKITVNATAAIPVLSFTITIPVTVVAGV